MSVLSRRVVITGASATAMLGLAGCASTPTRLTDVDPAYRRAVVQYATREPRGTIVVDPLHHYLYYVERGGQARLRNCRRRRRIWLVRRGHGPQQAGMAGLVSHQRNSRTPPRAHSRFAGIAGRPR